MQYFTQDEYNEMIRELLHTTPVCYDTMAMIAERTLKPYLRKLCNNDVYLRGRQCDDDIMQQVHMHLIQFCVTRFLYRNDTVNDSPEEFTAWLFTVAKNAFLDYVRKNHRIYKKEGEYPEDDTPPESSSDDHVVQTARERLTETFDVVSGLRSKVPMLLTWMAVHILVLCYVESNAKAIHILDREFSAKPMDKMLEWILTQIRFISF